MTKIYLIVSLGVSCLLLLALKDWPSAGRPHAAIKPEPRISVLSATCCVSKLPEKSSPTPQSSAHLPAPRREWPGYLFM
jgi:hypothetical protein